MSEVCKPRQTVRRQRSIYQVHYGLPRPPPAAPRPLAMPADPPLQAYRRQVAGHQDSDGTKYTGLLQFNNGTVLKPILKDCQKREIEFYERLATTSNADLVELRKLVPKYYGCKKFTYNGFEQDYIMLEDLTQRLLEPCIMDVKIGKRTWDPLASEAKASRERAKYAQCKQQYGFCIPGFQVHRLATGRLHSYNKDYGKKLHGHMVKEAIKTFLNGQGVALCRALLLQFLSQLWRIQRWARTQTAARLYCTSLLLLYDAQRLASSCDTHPIHPHIKCRPSELNRRRSIHSMHSTSSSGSSFSGQLSSKGPIFKKVNSVPIASMSLTHATFSDPPTITSPWSEALEKLNHNHSFEHNYEDKLSKIKMNYRAVLDQLSSDSPNPSPWGTVKIIDFAHAFFNDIDDVSTDDNFREGIDNFVEIFEAFLRETDDQVF